MTPLVIVSRLRMTVIALFVLTTAYCLPTTAFALSDTFQETFDNMTNGATVNGVDAWTVPVGSPGDAG